MIAVLVLLVIIVMARGWLNLGGLAILVTIALSVPTHLPLLKGQPEDVALAVGIAHTDLLSQAVARKESITTILVAKMKAIVLLVTLGITVLGPTYPTQLVRVILGTIAQVGPIPQFKTLPSQEHTQLLDNQPHCHACPAHIMTAWPKQNALIVTRASIVKTIAALYSPPVLLAITANFERPSQPAALLVRFPRQPNFGTFLNARHAPLGLIV